MQVQILPGALISNAQGPVAQSEDASGLNPEGAGSTPARAMTYLKLKTQDPLPGSSHGCPTPFFQFSVFNLQFHSPGSVAQSVELLPFKEKVAGSSPAGPMPMFIQPQVTGVVHARAISLRNCRGLFSCACPPQPAQEGPNVRFAF